MFTVGSLSDFIDLNRAFNLLTRAFNLATRAFSLLTHGFELVNRRFELVTVLLFHLHVCFFPFSGNFSS